MLINLPKMPNDIPEAKKCPSGNRYKTLYKYEYDENLKCPRRVANGKMDLQDYIQQSADDVDFKSIGKMLVDNRDNVVSHFTDANGETFDMTGLPRNIHEYELLHQKMQKSFDALEPEVKSLFANDFDLFAKAYKKGTLKGVFDTYTKAQKAKADEVGKEGGSKE